MSTVLWGARKGDIYYNSRAFWRRNIPIDPAVVHVVVGSTAFFEPWACVEIIHSLERIDPPIVYRIAGIEANTLGCVAA